MKVLIDECMPKRLAGRLSGHEVKTVPQMGWAGIKNGELLALAEKEFEVFLTVDQNLPFQQNLSRFKIAVVIVPCASNDIDQLLPFVPGILTALPKAKPGIALTVSG